MIKEIIKRDGTKVKFDAEKITTAMQKAMDATDVRYNSRMLKELTAIAMASLEIVQEEKGTISVEDANDAAENVLMINRETRKAARAFILHRETHKNVRQITGDVTDFAVKLVKGSLGTASLDATEMSDPCKELDIIKNQNASTAGGTIGAFILQVSEAVVKLFWTQVFDEEIIEYSQLGKKGFIYEHDLGWLGPYCGGWSIKAVIQKGITGVENKISCAPAKHLSVLCNQLVNFLGIMQNEWAGAQAFSSFDTYLAPFVKVDNLTYKKVKQAIQSFIHGVNTPSRWGSQCPFTNVTLDWTVPNDLAKLPAIVGGKEMDFCYGDCQKEMDMVNKAFLEVMIEGDANGRGFQYPIPTYSITKDFDWSDTENNRLLFEMAAKYGTPYFSNYINSDMNPSDVRSMCPLYSKEKVLVKDDFSKEFHLSTVEYLYKGRKANKIYTVLLDGQEKEARLNRFDGLTFYEIKLANGHKVRFSGNHMNLTMEGIKTTEELTTEDYLPFETVKTEGDGLTFEDGYMVGAFMGDGSLKDDYAVTYSLNDTSKVLVMDKVARIGVEKFGAKINTGKANESGTCLNVTLTSKMLRGLVEDYVSGKGIEKSLDVKAIGKSAAFREGIIAGLMDTDGNKKSRRIYTASEKGVESICAIFASLGIPTSVKVDKRDSTETLSDNPVFCVRPYDVTNGQESYKDIYRKANGRMWFRIESIEKMDTDSKIGYCFEVLNDDEPYFMMPSGLVTHNCRLRLDLRELRKQNGGNFGAGENTGSIGVVTINLPQIAYISKTEDEFFKTVEKAMTVAARSLDIKRKVVNQYLEKGAYPYTRAYLTEGFKNHFSTIGLVGMNEACLNAKWIGKDLTNKISYEWAKKVLNFMREKLSDFQEQYGCLFNLEATPAESTCYTLARKDKEKYPDIITAGTEKAPYYTNSSHLPVGSTVDVFDALDIQDELQTLYTSGTVFHTFLGEKLPTWESAAKLVRTVAENYRLPYFTLSPTYSVCENHGYIAGEVETCPHCGKKTEVYSRITGYYRPVSSWNDGKAQEFTERNPYSSFRKIDVTAKAAAQTPTEAPAPTPTETPAAPTTTSEAPILLVKETGCPKCKQAEALLAESGKADKVRVVPVKDEGEGIDLAIANNIMSAPAIIAGDNVVRNFDGVLDFIKKM